MSLHQGARQYTPPLPQKTYHRGLQGFEEDVPKLITVAFQVSVPLLEPIAFLNVSGMVTNRDIVLTIL